MVGDFRLDNSINPEAIINSAVTSLISKRRGGLTDRLWGKLLSHFPVMRADLVGIGCNTLCTNGKMIFYDPKFIRDVCLDAQEENRINQLADIIKFFLAHELMHVVYKNITPDKKDTTFTIPGPMDKAWEILHEMANKAQDAIINARLKKEFGIFPGGYNERDEEGNAVKKYKFCLYEGEVEKSWTQVFVETCASVNREMAKELGEKVEIPDGYYENIALFRELFNKYRKEHKQEKGHNMPDGSGSSGSGFQGQSGKINKEERSSGGSSGSSNKQSSGGASGTPQDQKEGQDKQGSAGSSGSKDQPENEEQAPTGGSLGDKQDQIDNEIREKIRKIIEKILSGDTTIDNHDQNEIEDVKKKIDRVMNEIRHEAKKAGYNPQSCSILITLAERYFRTKPEPWYVGISLLIKNKTSEGPQIRERVLPVEMLTQVMTGNSVVQFDKKSRQLDIAFAVDTSGSMSDEAMIAGVLKILGYLERNVPKGSQGHRFIFAQVDAGVKEWREMRIPSKEYNELKKSIFSEGFRRAGCGGTKFEPFFQKIAEMKKKPDAVVVFSDMELYDYPEVERACEKFKKNVIWLCSQETIPDEFYKHDIGRAYDASSLIDEIAIAR